MSRPLKVYGTLMMRRGKQYRVVVASATKKAAYEAMSRHTKSSYKAWDAYTSETGNKKEVEVATSKPNVVWINTNPHHWHSNAAWEILA